MKEHKYYSLNYWCDEENSADCECYTTAYYGFEVSKIAINFMVNRGVKSGDFVMLGVANGFTFNELQGAYQDWNFLGVDLERPPALVGDFLAADITSLTPESLAGATLIYNDIGNYQLTPLAKIWASYIGLRSLPSGSGLLCRNDANSIDFPLSAWATNLSCDEFRLSDLMESDGSEIDSDVLEGHSIFLRR